MSKKPRRYEDFPEVLRPTEAATLVGVSKPKFMPWVISGKTPFGPILEGVHYYKVSDEYRIIKDKLCELFGILPKGKNGLDERY